MQLTDYPAGIGFSSDLISLLSAFGLPELINYDDKVTISRALEQELVKDAILSWERMKMAKSTWFLCSVFSSPSNFYEAALFASSINCSALSIFLLTWTGSVSIHLFGLHVCLCSSCSQPLDLRHYFGCHLDVSQHLQLIVWARNHCFSDLFCFTARSFFLFSVRSKPCILTEEEHFIYEAVDSPDFF